MVRKTVCQVYVEHLENDDRGYPLWFPEPQQRFADADCTLPLNNEVRVGDVGYVDRHGQFVRFFNVREEIYSDPSVYKVENPSNPTDPDARSIFSEFEPLRVDNRIWDKKSNYIVDCVTSQTVKAHKLDESAEVDQQVSQNAPSINFHVSCDADQGAALFTSSGADREAVRTNLEWRDYMRKHHESWYRFAKDVLGESIEREDIVLVSGTVKSQDWMVVAYGGNGTNVGGGVQGEVPSIANLNLGFQYSASHKVAPEYRRGPFERIPRSQGSHRLITGSESVGRRGPWTAPFDQCLFISRYKIRWRIYNIPLRITGGAGPDQLPRYRDEHEGPVVRSEGEHVDVDLDEAKDTHRSSLDVLLDYMLEAKQDADVAIANDASLSSILKMYGEIGAPRPSTIYDILRRHPHLIKVDDSKTAFLSTDEITHDACGDGTQLPCCFTNASDAGLQQHQNSSEKSSVCKGPVIASSKGTVRLPYFMRMGKALRQCHTF